MQYQVNCKHCHRLFAITCQPGQTVKASCPYCATLATIATPYDATQGGRVGQTSMSNGSTSSNQPQQTTYRPSKPMSTGLGLKVVKVYIVVMLLLLLGASVLYWLFTTMSQ